MSRVTITENNGELLIERTLQIGARPPHDLSIKLTRVPTILELSGAANWLVLDEKQTVQLLDFFVQLPFIQDTVAMAARHDITYVMVNT